MAETDVKKQSSSQNPEGNRQELQRHQGTRGLSRSRERDPFGFSLSPSEFFSTNPFTAMRRMSEEMDRAFGQFFGDQGSGGTSGRESWYPAIEVAEREGQLHVHAELPGLKPEDVKVELTNDALVIKGERKYEHEHHVGKAYRSERRYGEFYREIPLPEGVNADQARAQFRNGVLEVSIPVAQQASRRREIPISTGETTGSSGHQAASAAAAGSSGSSASSGSSQKRG